MPMTEADLERMYPGFRGWLDDREWRLFLVAYSFGNHLPEELARDQKLRMEVWQRIKEKLDQWKIGRRGHGKVSHC